MLFSKALTVLAGAAVALVLAGGVVVLTAAATGFRPGFLFAGATTPKTASAAGSSSSPGQDGTPNAASAYCDRFVGHLASALNKKPDDVKKASAAALDQTLQDAVHNGDLTQQQADAIKGRRDGASLCTGAVTKFGPRAAGGSGTSGKPRPAFSNGLAGDVAQALGISPDDLQKQLAAGRSVKDIAAGQGLDEKAFRSRLLPILKADMDRQVAAGSLTQQQEDHLLQRFQNGPLPLWNRPSRPAVPPGQNGTTNAG